MVNVYKWPPVGILSSSWSTDQKLSKSRSMITGRRYVSSTQRPRITASCRVGGNSFDYTGHGYMETLKYFLEGGANLVRLSEWNEPYRNGMNTPLGQIMEELTWKMGTGVTMTWTENGQTILWAANDVLPVTQSGPSWTGLQIRGLPPSTTIVRPGQKLLAYDQDGINYKRVIITRPGATGPGGTLWVYFAEPLGFNARNVVLRSRESAVFEVDGPLPHVSSPVNEESVWDWKFRQVFPDEVDGGFTEIDPW